MVLAAHTNRILGALGWSKQGTNIYYTQLATGGGVGGPPKKEEKLDLDKRSRLTMPHTLGKLYCNAGRAL